jgi:hypothetical protein
MHSPAVARRWARYFPLSLAFALAAPVSAAAQGAPATARTQASSVHLEPIPIPHWVNSRSLLALNVLLGGVSAGVVAELRGGSFTKAFGNGAAGGIMTFLGKSVAARQFDGAGLVGRQLTAVGGAMVQNAALGLRPLDRMEFPIGPLDVLVDTRTRRLSARLDPIGATVIAIGVVHPRLRFDAEASLSAGVPVFRAREGMLCSPWSRQETSGLEIASVIFLAHLPELGSATQRTVFAHERVHTLQGDAFQAYWGRPLLEWLLPETSAWRNARPFLDVNLGDLLAELMDAALFQAYASRPGEIEAEALARHAR